MSLDVLNNNNNNNMTTSRNASPPAVAAAHPSHPEQEQQQQQVQQQSNINANNTIDTADAKSETNGNGLNRISDQPQVPVPEKLRDQLPKPTPPSRSNSSKDKKSFLSFGSKKSSSDKTEKKSFGKTIGDVFHRSDHHHSTNNNNHSRPRSSTIHTHHGQHSSAPHLPDPQPPKRAFTNQQQTNPFIKTNGSHASLHDQKAGSNGNNVASAILGTGADIAAPRNAHPPQQGLPPANAPLSRTSSFNNHNHPKLQYNPFGNNAPRIPSNYSNHAGSSGSVDSEEKIKLLPLPILDPNDFLPDDLKQNCCSVNDEYIIPEKGTKKLGDGASSQVFAINDKNTNKVYAFKKFCLLHKETPEEFYKRAAKEFIIAKRLNSNKHIVKTYYVLRCQTTINITRGWGFVLEYCKGGDLFSLISKTGWKQHPLAEKYCIFKQVANAVKFMHSQGIVHRDLKPENVLIHEDGCVKLTDFGVAEYGLENPQDLTSSIKMLTSFVGSPPYVSPEVMNLKGSSTSSAKLIPYDPFKLDLWALGMILFCIAYQGTPFRSATGQDNQYREYISSYTTYCQSNPQFRTGDKNHGPGPEFRYAKDFQSSGAARMAWRLCDPSEKTRYTIDAVFKDPWFLQVETCVGEEDDDNISSPSFDGKFISPESRIGSFDSTASKSMLDFSAPTAAPHERKPSYHQSQNTSAKTSPLVKPKSMLDVNEPLQQQELLPPVEEVDHEETQCSATVDQTTEHLKSLDTQDHGDVFFDASQENSPKLSPSTNTTQINGSQASINRASSFSSLASNRSVRSNTSVMSKRKKHHHLDITNVQNHSSSMKLKK